jgi:tetratricopeptide (TPR) repeat protein
MKNIFLLFCAGLISFGTLAQIETPQPSPFSKVEQKVGLTDVSIEYSRPGMRDREIFGNLVPFGKVWRTGANANTKITFSDDVKIAGKELKKGTYALYTIPNKDSWEILFYSDSNNWGTPEKWDDNKVALKATAEVQQMPMKMESFTILIDELKNNSAALNFIWESNIVTLAFEVPTDAKALASIEKVMNGPAAGDYFSAATYYHETGKDLKKALEWVNKAVKMQGDDAYWILRRKSLIEADLGMKKEAIASAKRSLASAEKGGNADYVKMNKDSLKEWGAN